MKIRISNFAAALFLLLATSVQPTSTAWADAATPPDPTQAKADGSGAGKKNAGKGKASTKPAQTNDDDDKDKSLSFIKANRDAEIDLPGVLKIDGESRSASDPTRVRRLFLTELKGTQVVHVSDTHANWIQLPFKNPHIIAPDAFALLDKRVNSNNVYFQLANQQAPIQMYLENPEGTTVVALALVPKRIPAQTVVIEDDSINKPNRQPLNDYEGNIQNVMETLATGNAPSGYAKITENIAPIVFKGMTLVVAQRYSNVANDIWAYEVTNPDTSAKVLKHEDFDGERVLAVSVFPTYKVEPKKTVKVFVMAKKARGLQ